MSATAETRRPAPPDVRSRKGGTPLVMLTAFTTPVARLVDAHCDIVLVGDSVGMVLHGLPSTLGVTMEMMILHGQAVARGLGRAMLVVDMPFGACEEGEVQALRNAARLMAATGAAAVIRIIPCPTIRETNGLAMSSRNVPLLAAERSVAPALYRAMQAAAAAVRGGAGPGAALAAGFAPVEYLDLRDAETLETATVLDRPARFLAAAMLGEVRLIDNIAA